MEKNKENIKDFWENQAAVHKESIESTTPDKVYKELEIRSIAKYIPEGASLLDVGCGNGISTLEFVRKKKVKATGVDYSEGMIKYARINGERSELDDVEFFQSDVLDLSNVDNTFDCVVTERSLINLETFDLQKEAILNIHSKLSDNGTFVMCENTVQGMNKINELRETVNLYSIPIRWHNLYFDEDKLIPFLEKHFEIVTIDPFASTYYIASRVFNAALTPEGQEPSFDSPINALSVNLPSIGDYCPVRIFVLQKK